MFEIINSSVLSLLYGPTLTPIHDYWKNQSFDYMDQKDVLFIIRDWNAKVGSQEIPGVTGRLGLGVQNDVRQRLAVFPREWTGHSKHPLSIAQEMTPHERHQIVNTKIRLIIFFAAKDGEALYSQQNQDQELTVTQLMNSLLPNSDLN